MTWSGAAARVGLGVLLALCAGDSSLLAAAQQRSAPEIVLTLDPQACAVRWTVDSTLHMVHGTFALKRGRVDFDPQTGEASGEIVVSASSGESGNGSRDKRMRQEILETEKYPEAIFRPQRVEGEVRGAGKSEVKVAGVFSVHGADHEIRVLIHVELLGDRWSGNGEFEVPYVKWGIKDPSNFLLKVKPVVKVELEMSGAVMK